MLKKLILALIAFLIFLIAVHVLGGYYPDKITHLPIRSYTQTDKIYSKAKPLKVLTWNVQGFIGKNYLPKHEKSGIDFQFNAIDIYDNFLKCIQVIKKEQPDVIMLQEVAGETPLNHFLGQDHFLIHKLGKEYPYVVQCDYWKHRFFMNPHIMGPIAIRLMILSRYKLQNAERISLPYRIFGNEFLGQLFPGKFCLLKVEIATHAKTQTVKLLNTHTVSPEYDAHNHMLQLQRIYEEIRKVGGSWLIGGDFNYIPPGMPTHNIYVRDRYVYHQRNAEVWPQYFQSFCSAFSLWDLIGHHSKKFMTYAPNKPLDTNERDRVLDYIFYSKDLRKIDAYVLGKECEGVSDHFPLFCTFVTP